MLNHWIGLPFFWHCLQAEVLQAIVVASHSCCSDLMGFVRLFLRHVHLNILNHPWDWFPGPAQLFFRPLLEAVPQQMRHTLPIGADPIEEPCRLAETQLLDHIRHSTLQGPKMMKILRFTDRLSFGGFTEPMKIVGMVYYWV